MLTPRFPIHDSPGRYAISWWRTSFGHEESNSLANAVANEHISQGMITAEFEAQIASALGVPYCVTTTSGSAALLMALMALGVGRDDEVIIPNRTWIATAHAAAMLGARVVFVDVHPDFPTMDVSQIREKITSRTRVIMPVHLNGRAVDMTAIRELAREYGLRVIEDTSQALFAKNQNGFLGTQSDAGCFSLSIAKLISTGQGGLVVTRSEEMYAKLKLIRSHGVTDVVNADYMGMGFNFKYTDLQAAFGLVQLSKVPSRIAQLVAVYDKYEKVLQGVPFLKLLRIDHLKGEVPLYIEVLCSERRKLINFLEQQGIQARPFYPDLHLAAHLCATGSFPNSKVFSEQGLFLPCGPAQSFENIDLVAAALQGYARQG